MCAGESHCATGGEGSLKPVRHKILFLIHVKRL